MRMVIINGSPRGKEGNTGILLNYFLRGVRKIRTNEFKEYCLKEISEYTLLIREILDSDTMLVGFPIYVTSLPGVVKSFFEELENFREKLKDISAIYIIQSNYTRANQSKYIHRHCKEISARLGCHHLGSIVRCSSLGMRFMPERDGDLLKLLRLGKEFGRTGSLDREIAERYLNMERGVRFTIPFKSAAGLRLTMGCPENNNNKDNSLFEKYKQSSISNKS